MYFDRTGQNANVDIDQQQPQRALCFWHSLSVEAFPAQIQGGHTPSLTSAFGGERDGEYFTHTVRNSKDIRS